MKSLDPQELALPWDGEHSQCLDSLKILNIFTKSLVMNCTPGKESTTHMLPQPPLSSGFERNISNIQPLLQEKNLGLPTALSSHAWHIWFTADSICRRMKAFLGWKRTMSTWMHYRVQLWEVFLRRRWGERSYFEKWMLLLSKIGHLYNIPAGLGW